VSRNSAAAFALRALAGAVVSLACVLVCAGSAMAAPDVTMVSAGAFHTCVVTSVGGVDCWGQDGEGELGDGMTGGENDATTPVAVTGLSSGVAAVSAGWDDSCALTTNGSVECWGDNTEGQLGDGTTADSATPVQVSGLTSGLTAIASGVSFSCALTSAGGVECWGSNADGQLGDGTTTDSTTPVAVSGLSSGVIAIAAGEAQTCALTSVGGVECWGYNNDGQLGDGTTANSSTPGQVGELSSGVTAITTGWEHTCALTSAEGVECWGDNEVDQLGDGTTTDSATPVAVTGLSSGVATIAAGEAHTCAVTSAGGVECWGYNSWGQLGDGTNADSPTPVDVSGLGSGISALAAGALHTCALTTAGGVECWGYDVDGELGNATTATSSVPPVDVSWLEHQTISWSQQGPYAYGDGPVTLDASASSGLPVTYSVESGPCSISGSTLTLTGGGSCDVAANQSGDSTYAPTGLAYGISQGAQTITINRATPTITWPAPAAITYGTGLGTDQFDASATGVDGEPLQGTFIYTPGTDTVLDVGPNQTLSVTFDPTPSENSDYTAPDATTVITVNQAAQTIAWPQQGPYAYGAGTVALEASASSGLAVSYAVDSGACSVSGSSLTFNGPGSCVLDASQGGDSNYIAAQDASQTITLNRATQTIDWPQQGPYVYGNGPVALEASATSGLTVGYTIQSGPCSVSGSSLTLSAPGSCVVDAAQAGDSNTAAADEVPQTITVTQATQTIDWSQQGPYLYDNGPVELDASASSKLAVSYTVQSGLCSASASSLTLTGPGTCVVEASQAGNPDYAAAQDVSQTITVNGATQTISWPQQGPYAYGNNPVRLDAAVPTELPVSYAIQSGPCSVSGSWLAFSGPGSCVVDAAQSGDSFDAPATSISQTITVGRATPSLLWPTPAAITFGTALRSAQLNAKATGMGGRSLAGTFTYKPALRSVLNAGGNQTLRVSFAPSDSGDYRSTGTTVRITVKKAPSRLSAAAVTARGISVILNRPDTGRPVSGQTVALKAGSQTLCTAVTNSSGTASCTSAAAITTAVLNGGYSVSYAGTSNYLASTAKASATSLGQTLVSPSGHLTAGHKRVPLKNELQRLGRQRLLEKLRALRRRQPARR
jgi:trimeric autotransporter adhesin